MTNKRRYVSRAFRGGKRDANNALAQLVAEVDREGVHTEATIDRLLTAHIDHLATRGRQQRTIDGYRTIARAIAKHPVGERPLKKVTVKTIDDFYDRLVSRGLSPATVQRYLSVPLTPNDTTLEAGPTGRTPGPERSESL